METSIACLSETGWLVSVYTNWRVRSIPTVKDSLQRKQGYRFFNVYCQYSYTAKGMPLWVLWMQPRWTSFVNLFYYLSELNSSIRILHGRLLALWHSSAPVWYLSEFDSHTKTSVAFFFPSLARLSLCTLPPFNSDIWFVEKIWNWLWLKCFLLFWSLIGRTDWRCREILSEYNQGMAAVVHWFISLYPNFHRCRLPCGDSSRLQT